MLDSPAQVVRFAPLAGAGASPVKQHAPPTSPTKANALHDSADKENHPTVAHTPVAAHFNYHPVELEPRE